MGKGNSQETGEAQGGQELPRNVDRPGAQESLPPGKNKMAKNRLGSHVEITRGSCRSYIEGARWKKKGWKDASAFGHLGNNKPCDATESASFPPSCRSGEPGK